MNMKLKNDGLEAKQGASPALSLEELAASGRQVLSEIDALEEQRGYVPGAELAREAVSFATRFATDALLPADLDREELRLFLDGMRDEVRGVKARHRLGIDVEAFAHHLKGAPLDPNPVPASPLQLVLDPSTGVVEAYHRGAVDRQTPICFEVSGLGGDLTDDPMVADLFAIATGAGDQEITQLLSRALTSQSALEEAAKRLEAMLEGRKENKATFWLCVVTLLASTAFGASQVSMIRPINDLAVFLGSAGIVLPMAAGVFAFPFESAHRGGPYGGHSAHQIQEAGRGAILFALGLVNLFNMWEVNGQPNTPVIVPMVVMTAVFAALTLFGDQGDKDIAQAFEQAAATHEDDLAQLRTALEEHFGDELRLTRLSLHDEPPASADQALQAAALEAAQG